jgi:hypothetical protein
MSAKPILWAGLAAALLSLAPMSAAADHRDGYRSGRVSVHSHRVSRERHRFHVRHARPRPAWFGRYGGPGVRRHGLRTRAYRAHGWRHAPYRRYHPYYPRTRLARRGYFHRAYHRPVHWRAPACRVAYSPCGYAPLYTVGYGTAFVRPIYLRGVNFGRVIYNRPGCACY